MRPLLIACLVVLFGTGAGAGESRDRLAIGITQFPATLHPGIEPMLAKVYVLGLARRPLVVYDADWRLVCLLCTELPTFDNGRARRERTPAGGEGVAVTLTLRAGAFWGDGTPVTGRDVVFAWEVGRDPRSGVLPIEFYRRLYRIDLDDERTVTLHFDRLTFDYNAITALEPLPAHLEREAFADPAAYRQRTRYVTDPTHPGLYDGPYVVDRIAAGSHILLKRNPHWRGPVPAFATILVKVIDNTAALEANLLSGGIDMIAGELGPTLDQAIAFEARHGRRFTVLYQPGLVYEHIDLNLDNPILADLRVRRALLLAIDRQAIAERLFAGRQPVAHGPVSPLDRMHASDAARHPFDPAQAARLLAEAGWQPGADGIRRDGAGRPLALEFMTTAGDRTRELIQQVLQSQWRQVGIDIRIRNQPARVFFGDTISRRRFGGLALFAWISAPDSVPRTTLHSSEIPSPENGFAGQNTPGFRNAEVDRLIDAIEVELDEERRRALWRRLQHIYADELPALPLFFRANAFVLPKWLEGIRPTGHQYPTTLWVTDWRVGSERGAR
jgi:peptide/nickel transport system substrate-binding protein